MYAARIQSWKQAEYRIDTVYLRLVLLDWRPGVSLRERVRAAITCRGLMFFEGPTEVGRIFDISTGPLADGWGGV